MQHLTDRQPADGSIFYCAGCVREFHITMQDPVCLKCGEETAPGHPRCLKCFADNHLPEAQGQTGGAPDPCECCDSNPCVHADEVPDGWGEP
jgi:hypothetical protein